MNIDTVSVTQLKSMLEEGAEVALLDVREGWERDAFNIGGMHIPLNEILARINEIPTDKTVVVYCRKGIRSQLAIQRLQQKNMNNLVNLTGGMDAWIGDGS
jgi:rhodanese-related sulfurtransferase